jgi:hypothetical protein
MNEQRVTGAVRSPWDIAHEEAVMNRDHSTPRGRMWGARVLLATSGVSASLLLMLYGAIFNIPKLVADAGLSAAIFVLAIVYCIVAVIREDSQERQ